MKFSDILKNFVAVFIFKAAGPQDQILALTNSLQKEQSEKAFLKSENVRLQSDLANLREKVTKLEEDIKIKEELLKKRDEEVCLRPTLVMGGYHWEEEDGSVESVVITFFPSPK